MSASHKQMGEAGWRRVDAKPWGKLAAFWRHRAGWTLQHCGHPTALRPWILRDAAGEMWLTGAQYATPPNRTFGTAWPSLADVVEFLATHEKLQAMKQTKKKSKRRILETRAVAVPASVSASGGATVQLELVNCGNCRRCRRSPAPVHGPYWYAYLWKPATNGTDKGRHVSRYIGKELDLDKLRPRARAVVA